MDVVSHIVLAVKENQFSLRLVIGMTSKSGGKNGKHCPVTDTSKISAIVNMSLQVFQHRFGCQFRATTDATMSVQSCHFQLLPSIHFLCLLDSPVQATVSAGSSSMLGSISFVQISQSDMGRFETLRRCEKELLSVMKNSKKRGEIAGGDSD